MSKKNYFGALYNVGPLSDDEYCGVHTYSQVLFPFINECRKNNIYFAWIGDELKNKKINKKVDELIKNKKLDKIKTYSPNIEYKKVSNDLLDISKFDFLLLQPRPIENILESFTVDYLIYKFVNAGKRVFLWEQDLFPINKKWKKNKFVTHLRPYTKPNNEWLDDREFLFSYDNRKINKYSSNKRLFDFVYIGNVYGRQDAFKRYLKNLNVKNNAIFGNWIDSEKKKKFSSKFTNLNFYGSTTHNCTLPLLNASLATLQILPDDAAKIGLMTARVFNCVTANTLCFFDYRIRDSEKFVPKFLIIKNSYELNNKITELKRNKRLYDSLIEERNNMMKEHSVKNRVKQFKSILNELCK